MLGSHQPAGSALWLALDLVVDSVRWLCCLQFELHAADLSLLVGHGDSTEPFSPAGDCASSTHPLREAARLGLVEVVDYSEAATYLCLNRGELPENSPHLRVIVLVGSVKHIENIEHSKFDTLGLQRID